MHLSETFSKLSRWSGDLSRVEDGPEPARYLIPSSARAADRLLAKRCQAVEALLTWLADPRKHVFPGIIQLFNDAEPTAVALSCRLSSGPCRWRLRPQVSMDDITATLLAAQRYFLLGLAGQRRYKQSAPTTKQPTRRDSLSRLCRTQGCSLVLTSS